jgi:hypothetical protein
LVRYKNTISEEKSSDTLFLQVNIEIFCRFAHIYVHVALKQNTRKEETMIACERYGTYHGAKCSKQKGHCGKKKDVQKFGSMICSAGILCPQMLKQVQSYGNGNHRQPWKPAVLFQVNARAYLYMNLLWICYFLLLMNIMMSR